MSHSHCFNTAGLTNIYYLKNYYSHDSYFEISTIVQIVKYYNIAKNIFKGHIELEIPQKIFMQNLHGHWS